MKNIVILGASGSIGSQTLDVISQHKSELNCIGISVHHNIQWLKDHLLTHTYQLVVVKNKQDKDDLSNLFKTQVFDYGDEGLIHLATLNNVDVVVNALVGFAGLVPTLKAIEQHKDIALANKETLVVAGKQVMDAVNQYKVNLRPIDSEHSAILQALQGNSLKDVERIIVTASGGSFRDKSREDLKHVSVRDALNHPNWSMGQKITIDSATLVNKAFEVIEAHWLFNLPYEKIEVVIHKESIIHSMVEYKDGSIMAQLGSPDMRVPIQYALCGPQRLTLNSSRLDFNTLGQLNFKPLDASFYPCFPLIIEAAQKGGNQMVIVNAANEAAVQLFLEGKIKFLEIESIIRNCLVKYPFQDHLSIDDMVRLDKQIKYDVLNEVKENV
jgi:1-deoxy-D-xylulose-5-phosphate reductoisomerase